eukprot:TRINITY_DN11429_c0_g1_i1.p1 TRINITY_DN11429_c0_g1~~TRINITY_DN11429_c0_g1_i1.p1  ORF type:complete len:375 (+),score=133.38 TRINITY_DN11429_c0_g1_i1:213-1337(+)
MPVAEHNDLRAARALKMNELAQKSKSMNVGMEGWAMGQGNMSSTVEKHSHELVMMKTQVAEMDKVVKQHAAIMSGQDLHKLQQDRRDALEAMENKIMRHVQDVINENNAKLQKSISQVAQSIQDNAKRLKESEDMLIEHISEKLAEAASHRNANTDNVEKLRLRCDQFDEELSREGARLREMVQGKHQEIKRSTQMIQQEVEAEKVQRDKMMFQNAQDLQKKLEAIKAEVDASNKQMRQMMDKMHEENSKSHASNASALASQLEERNEISNTVLAEMHEQINKIKRELDRNYANKTGDLERKFSSVGNYLADIRSQLEQERKVREHADIELSTALNQERKDRDVDEDRLLGMISAIHAAIDKVHSSSMMSAGGR